MNIFSYLRDLRQQRSGLVATQDHYKLIYSLIEEFLILGIDFDISGVHIGEPQET